MSKTSYKNPKLASELSRRGEWLSGLTDRQVRALASQRKVTGWDHQPLVKLIGDLMQFEDIDVPVRG
jgi:hypothetical protein